MDSPNPGNLESRAFARGDHIDVTLGADTPAGTVASAGGLVGAYSQGGASGEVASLQIEGVLLITNPDGTAFSQGASVHWDDTAKKAVAAAGDFILGRAAWPAASGDRWVATKLIQPQPT